MRLEFKYFIKYLKIGFDIEGKIKVFLKNIKIHLNKTKDNLLILNIS